MSGTGVAQVVSFALIPIISRLFDPADFGVFGSFNSVLSVLAAIVTFQYAQAIMLPKKDEDAANVFAVSILATCITSFFCLFLAYICSDWLLGILKASQARWMLWFLPICLFISGINQSFGLWCVRKKAFKKTAYSQIARAGAVNILQILTGSFHAGSTGLITSAVVADSIAALNLGHQIFVLDKELIANSINRKDINRQAKEYIDFPLYSCTQNVVNALMQGLPVLILAHYYDISVAGAYSFGTRVLLTPYNFILTAFRQVFFQKATEVHNQGKDLYPLFLKASLYLLALSIPFSFLFFFWSPDLFAWFFGERWRVAGNFASWLVFWLMAGFCSVPSVIFARILRKQKQFLFYEILHLIASVICLLVGCIYYKPDITIIVFSFIGMISNMILIFWIAILTQRFSLKKTTII